MTDREQVIAELTFMKRYVFEGSADYKTLDKAIALLKGQEEEIENLKQTAQSMMEGICLLKEQEPASPTWSNGKAYCGKCGQRLPRKRADREINYCGYCGQAVKWE